MSMKRIALVAALLLCLAGTARASAADLPCGLPESRPLWVDFADGSVSFRLQLFGRPGLVLASSGLAGPAQLRALGAQTVFWWMKLQRYVGTPARPADPATIPAGAEDLYARAVASSGCEQPVIALNELWGGHQPTPWLYENLLYRQNVLSLLKALAGKGAVPFLLVAGPHSGNRAPFVDGDARAWWLEVSQYAHIVRQMHFNAPHIYDMGPIVGARTRRIAMRAAVTRFTNIGIPADRLALVLGFQSGPGKGGREGLQPSARVARDREAGHAGRTSGRLRARSGGRSGPGDGARSTWPAPTWTSRGLPASTSGRATRRSATGLRSPARSSTPRSPSVRSGFRRDASARPKWGRSKRPPSRSSRLRSGTARRR